MSRIIDKLAELFERLVLFSIGLLLLVLTWVILFAIFASWAQAKELEPRQIECLTRAIYFEARNQPLDGQMLVAHVVLNRVRHPEFPSTPCAVVHQKRQGVCQFSWACTSLRVARPRDQLAWRVAGAVAQAALRTNLDGAPDVLYFHARSQRRWRHLVEVAEIEDHVFYGDRR